MKRGTMILVPWMALFLRCTSPETVGQLDAAIRVEGLRAHLQMLADDLLEGRAPGTRGAELAARYIASQFQESGLRPGVGDSSYFQPVELIGVTAQFNFRIRGAGRFWRLTQGPEFVGRTYRLERFVSERNREIVYVGFGITAPEFGRDDYSGVDVAGKVPLVLLGEPPSSDSSYFAGEAWTSYAFADYKRREALRRGAVGVILVHAPTLFAVDWEALRGSASAEQLFLKVDPDTSQLAFECVLHHDVARELFAALGQDFDEAARLAAAPDFQPEVLPLRTSVSVTNELREFVAANVVAKVPGDGPQREEAVLLSAHYDHLGVRDVEHGDGIFNGAYDNASGVAVLLEVARAVAASPLRPKRTVLFAAFTGEEAGHLGSTFYAQQASVPLTRTVANLNFDGVAPGDRPDELRLAGIQLDKLAEPIRAAARRTGMRVVPAASGGALFCQRPHAWPPAEAGVPSLFFTAAASVPSESDGAGSPRADFRDRLHTVSDAYQPTWSLRAATEAGQFAFRLVLHLSRQP